jgi:hypothetical protein
MIGISGAAHRTATMFPLATGIPTEWEPGEFDYETGEPGSQSPAKTLPGWPRLAARVTATRLSPAARFSWEPITGMGG